MSDEPTVDVDKRSQSEAESCEVDVTAEICGETWLLAGKPKPQNMDDWSFGSGSFGSFWSFGLVFLALDADRA